VRRLLLCIDNRIYREGISHLLRLRGDFDQVINCENLDQTWPRPVLGASEVAVVDVFPQETGEVGTNAAVDRVHRALVRAGSRPLVAFGLHENDDEVLACVEAGASGYVTRNDSLEELVLVIEAAECGELRCPPKVADMMRRRLVSFANSVGPTNDLSKLSRRERHVLELLEQSLSNKEIARSLNLEVSTIKNHVHNIIVKLSVRSREEAAALLRSGLGWNDKTDGPVIGGLGLSQRPVAG